MATASAVRGDGAEEGPAAALPPALPPVLPRALPPSLPPSAATGLDGSSTPPRSVSSARSAATHSPNVSSSSNIRSRVGISTTLPLSAAVPPAALASAEPNRKDSARCERPAGMAAACDSKERLLSTPSWRAHTSASATGFERLPASTLPSATIPTFGSHSRASSSLVKRSLPDEGVGVG